MEKFVKNPTKINGKATTYVSHFNDSGIEDGTKEHPYSDITTAITAMTADSNIMLGDGVWGYVDVNKKKIWWGNSKTEINSGTPTKNFYNDFHNIVFGGTFKLSASGDAISGFDVAPLRFFDCKFVVNIKGGTNSVAAFKNCELYDESAGTYHSSIYINCFLVKSVSTTSKCNSCILLSPQSQLNAESDYNYFGENSIPTNGNTHSVNDASLGVTFSDCVNYYDADNLSDTESMLRNDLTLKPSSPLATIGNGGSFIGPHNIGHRFAITSIGISENHNVQAVSSGLRIAQPTLTITSATSNTITFVSNTVNLTNCTIKIVSGTGAGQKVNVSSYDTSTYTATVIPSMTTIPDNTSVVALSGWCELSPIDLGNVMKISKVSLATYFSTVYGQSLPQRDNNGKWLYTLNAHQNVSVVSNVSAVQIKYSIDSVNYKPSSWFPCGLPNNNIYSSTDGESTSVSEGSYFDWDDPFVQYIYARYIKIRVYIETNY